MESPNLGEPVPREPVNIFEYQKVTDPYTNGEQDFTDDEAAFEEDGSGTSRHPYVVAFSVFMLLIFFVPVIIQVINFSH